MKKVRLFTLGLLIVLPAAVSTGCGGSKEKPIPGTSLVTYTVEHSDKLGIKEPGEGGKVILYAECVAVEYYGKCLWIKTERDADFDLIPLNNNPDRKKVILSSVKVLENGSNYRIIEDDSDYNKGYISEAGKIIPYKRELFVVPFPGNNYIFASTTEGRQQLLSDDTNYGVMDNKYQKIFILSSRQGKEITIIGEIIDEYKRAYDHIEDRWYMKDIWHVRVKTGDGYSDTKAYTSDEVNALSQGATIKWSEKNGALAVYEKSL
jgi:hypothetical protein